MDFTKLSPQEVLDLAKPCAEYEAALKAQIKPQLDWSDSSKALATLRYLVTAQEKADQSDPDVEEETVHAPARDGFPLLLKVFRGASSSTTTDGEKPGSPLIVLYYGGGFVVGSPGLFGSFARQLVKRFHAVVVAPTYRLAPEHPFPTGFNDGWDAFSWIAENASGPLCADPSKGFLIGGVSSGANISNVVAHLARDNGLQPPITGLWLSCAGIRLAPKDADKLPEKYRERYLSRAQDSCLNSGVTTSDMAKLIKESLKPDPDSHLYSPMIWPTEAGHKDLPKTYSQVCGMEPSRDETLIFDDMLKNEGVPTRLDLYVGLPHAFFYSFRDLPQTKDWEKDTMDGFAWLLDS